MKKNKFLLPFIAIVLMLGSFAFIYFDLRSEGNTYVEDTKISKEAKKEAEAAVLFSDLKRNLSISYATTSTKTFEWYLASNTPVTVKGWGISNNVDTVLLNKVEDYFKANKFIPDATNTVVATNTFGYKKDTLVCLFTSKDGVSVEVSVIDLTCGYLDN